MKRINQLAIDDKRVLKKIINEQDEPEKTSLNNVYDYLLEDYNIYSANRNTLELMSPDSRVDTLKNELINCYTEGKYIDKVKKKVKDNLPVELKGLCLYCMISEPSTLDHYICKSRYPEFSVYTKNLVPCCRDCNTYKSSTWKRGGKRIVFNPYFDDPIIDEYLFVDIRVRRTPYIHRLRLNFSGCTASKDDIDLVRAHYEKLHLMERYKEMSISYLQELVGELYANDRTEIEKSLNNKIRSFDINNGPNFWRTAVCRSILRNNRVIDWLSI